MKKHLKRQQGNVVEFMATGLCILAMCGIMMYFFDYMDMIGQKNEAVGLARKYILRMETVGCLMEGDRQSLIRELEELGIEEIVLDGTTFSLEGTTFSPVTYGQPVALIIKGRLKGGLYFEERKVSTAKN